MIFKDKPLEPPMLLQPVHADDSSMTVAFQPPPDNDDFPINGYVLRVEPGE